MSKQELNWQQAEDNLKEWEERYQELVGMAGVNPFFAIALLKGYRKRYENGERTRELFDEMMNIE